MSNHREALGAIHIWMNRDNPVTAGVVALSMVDWEVLDRGPEGTRYVDHSREVIVPPEHQRSGAVALPPVVLLGTPDARSM